ncbi:MAG: deoxyribodipyrimidine photolyase [Myxococcales bacterium]|nr:deoxyribodipyrimidine photolyase [Myxococcales bacterium]
MRPVPALRLRRLNDQPERPRGDVVLYWMTAARRPAYNFALQHAAARAAELGRPLIVLEALRAGYRWASARLHRFVIDGMADNAAAFDKLGIAYYPYVEPEPGAGRGLLEALAQRAALVVGDDYPCFFLPRMQAAVAKRLPVAFDVVDSNGLLPLRAGGGTDYPTAYAFRRHLQRVLPPHLLERPLADLPAAALPPAPWPRAIERRWPRASSPLLEGEPAALAALPIDHDVAPVAGVRGGFRAARAQLETFLDERLARYSDERNQPETQATSELSPYLHFGHVSVHEVFDELMDREGWSIDRLGEETRGARRGFWGASEAAESFLDELVTWRELGFNFCAHRDDYAELESLPSWALKTIAEHADDPRPHVYSLEQLDRAQTHDPLWNAAQMQLGREGRIHNYLRMLWGKKIYEWSRDARAALGAMIELNNRYALDGRDPNSYSGIFWVLGRYDRAWGPERPIYGKLRYMTSENTARKVRVKDYIAQHGARQQQLLV